MLGLGDLVRRLCVLFGDAVDGRVQIVRRRRHEGVLVAAMRGRRLAGALERRVRRVPVLVDDARRRAVELEDEESAYLLRPLVRFPGVAGSTGIRNGRRCHG